MSKSTPEMKMGEAIDQVLSRADSALEWNNFVQQVLELWPSKAKNPATSIRSELRYDGGRQVVWLDKQTLIPVRLAMRGLRFRIPFTSLEAQQR
jgi:hypothetical protein